LLATLFPYTTLFRSFRWLSLALVVAAVTVAPVHAGGISGQYIEARTCDVWTGPCFANADMSLDGKHAVMAWKVDKGALDSVRLRSEEHTSELQSRGH